MMAAVQEKASQLYREIAQIPVATEGRIFRSGNGLYEVEVKWSQKDLERGNKVTFAKSYLVRRDPGSKKLSVLSSNSFQRDAASVSLECYSTCGKFRAVLMKGKSSKMESGAEPQQFIEIWDSSNLIKSFNVKEQFGKKHGKINDDDQFSSFQLSFDGSKLLYVAEKKVPDSIPYFKKKNNGDEDKGSEPKEMGTEYVYRQSWGEQLTTVINPIIVVLDIKTEECTVIDSPSNYSCGRARWVPDSTKELVYVGYDNEPLKLGFVYCFNRKSTLFCANVDTNVSTPLTDGTKYIFGLRFNGEPLYLLFIENDADLPYPHMSCARVRMVDWNTKKIETLVDLVDKPTNEGFTGVYAYSLPDRCWGDNDKMYFHDCQKSYREIMRLDVNTKSISCITSDTEKGAYAVFDVFDGLLLGRYANPAQPMKIFIAELPSSSDGFKETDFCEIATTTVSISDNIKWEVLPLKREDSSGYPYEALFVSPRVVESLPPLIVLPHGGPHTSSIADFFVWTTCLVGLGYSIVFVNYNGSIGYGQDFIKSLLGNVGTLDVNDVQFAAESLVKRGSVDASRVFALGGSHGGFLSVHLVSQFPDFYKATFVRNPVINIASMRNETDIIDWTHSVTGLPYDPKVTPTPDQYSKMLEMSPIVHAHKIKAAVTLAVGAEDHRCPPSQARELYTLLHAQGKDVNMFLYPKDCHPLMSVDTDADCYMHCVLLFNKYS